MKGLIITSKGVEETAAIEVNELIGAECKAQEGCVIFDFGKFSDLCLLCYKSQSADRVILLIGSFEFADFFTELKKFIDESEFDEWICKNKKFKTECIRVGEHDFNSVEAERKAGEFILKKSKGRNIKFDMKDYETIFFVYIVNGKCYFGIDFAGFEMNKRDYKIFLASNSLRGTIAYSLVRESGFKKKDVLLDPFSRDGIIPIEAAFHACSFPHSYYKKERFAFLKLNLGIDFESFFKELDKSIKKSKTGIFSYDHVFKYVDYCKKNAKIAGVDKSINFSRIELEWLDIKFRKGSVDRIVTNPPLSKNADLDKIYREFFYQSKYILNKKGTVAIISRLPDFVKSHAIKQGFSVLREKDAWSGEQPLKIIVLGLE